MARDNEPGIRKSKKPLTVSETPPAPTHVDDTIQLVSGNSLSTALDYTGQGNRPAEAGARVALDAWLAALLASSEDGYVKICTGNDGKSHYLYFKWTRGPWRGHYVVAVVDRGDLSYGGQLLYSKVAAVHLGEKRPKKDTYPT